MRWIMTRLRILSRPPKARAAFERNGGTTNLSARRIGTQEADRLSVPATTIHLDVSMLMLSLLHVAKLILSMTVQCGTSMVR